LHYVDVPKKNYVDVCVVLQAAFNLLVCCYALGDKEGMMAAFQRLLTVPGLAEAKALQVGRCTHMMKKGALRRQDPACV
jgi:hypothetical protein